MEIRTAVGIDNIPDARYIREEVFMKEQGFVCEFDEHDDKAFHAVIYIDGSPAATGRAYITDRAFIGRLAVMKEYRGQHLGSKVLSVLEEHLRDVGADNAELSAQTRVRAFYEAHGYTAVGDTYLDEHTEHIRMIKTI